jgi:tubulin-specific chaperone E
MDALKQRYGTVDDDNTNNDAGTALGSAFVQDKKWMFVGAEKAAARQRQYDRLALVVLRGCGITCAMTPGETAEHNAVKEANMARLTELDLSENTGLTLGEVGKLPPYFPRLTTLQLCDMPTLLLSSTALSAAGTVQPLLTSPHLTKLVLNNTGFTSLAQLRALIAAPALTELHLDSNQLTSLEIATKKGESNGSYEATPAAAAATVFPNVTTLSLAHNNLSDWAALGVAITHAFPALTQLYLTDNKLKDLTLSEGLIAHHASVAAVADGNDAVTWTPVEERELQPYAFLRPLTLLCVKDNATLVSPATVDAIRVLCPYLTTFRITYHSLLPAWNETNSRMYVVAALPTVTLLNRGTVRQKERLDSELLYVQRGLQQRARAAAASATVPPEIPYPLVDVLREKHKDVVLSILQDGDATATTTAAGASNMMLNVSLIFTNGYAAGSATALLSTQKQRLPSLLTVAKLKALVQQVFQVKPVHQRLSYRSGDHGVLETQTPLDNEQESLGYYGVPDGAIIYVEDTSLRS